MSATTNQLLQNPALAPEQILPRLAWLRDVVRPRLDRYLGYYRNPATELTAFLPCSPSTSLAVRPFRQFQEAGLPARITGFRTRPDGTPVPNGQLDLQRKEVVIENDIAWRINTLVDFAAAYLPAITSTAQDPAQRQRITRMINDLLTAAGGPRLLQQLVLLGAIHGSAWLQLRPSPELLAQLADTKNDSANGLGGNDTPWPEGTQMAAAGVQRDVSGGQRAGSGVETVANGPDVSSLESPAIAPSAGTLPIARWLQLETVPATRLCPLPAASAAVLHESDSGPHTADNARTASLLQRLGSWIRGNSAADVPHNFSFDLFTPTHWQRYLGGELAEEAANPLGELPFIRYENQSDPAAGTRIGHPGSETLDPGISEVEPLISMQDELNTRLSDRAFRVTMTSFRMYLGKGIEGFSRLPVGPGQMWSTDNPDAAIDTFGGDAACPSEDAHIGEVREALDKISGVTPVAAGLIRGKVGNLTSAVALRITLIALLARTANKRAALTQALEETVRKTLAILDRAGLLKTDPADRGIDINWPTPLPESDLDRLTEAQAKLALGIPRAVVLEELGYGETLNAER